MIRRTGILHGPSNTAGNPYGLSRAERELGLRSIVAVLEGHRFDYEVDVNLGLTDRDDEDAKNKKLAFLGKAVRDYRVFHYAYGGYTFFHHLDEEGRVRSEVPWLKRLGKKVIATFVGDDARPPEGFPFMEFPPEVHEHQGKFQQQRIDLMARYADRIFYLNPDLRKYLPDSAEFRPYASVDPQAITPTDEPAGEEVVIAHAPTDRVIKGTQHVVDAVDALREEGLPVRIELIEGVPHTEVAGRLAKTHILVDQLMVGWYGALAVEAMSLGRPALAYIADEEEGDNPFGEELAIVRTTPETLRDDLRPLVTDRARRLEVGRAGRAFVERHHDPRQIARRNLEGLVKIPRKQ